MKNRVTEMEEEEKKHNRKTVFFIILLATCVFFIAGVVAAYFSDMFTKSGTVQTGTLDINGSYTVTRNGLSTELDEIRNLNPGDVIVITGTVSNLGNKSAWVRDEIAITPPDSALMDYLMVYTGSYTQADFAGTGGQTPGEPLTLTEDGLIVSENRVINGFGTYGEIESGEDYNYLNATSYDIALTIYFLPEAGNDLQGQNFGLSISSKALQFKNNNAAEPDEEAWDNVAELIEL